MSLAEIDALVAESGLVLRQRAWLAPFALCGEERLAHDRARGQRCDPAAALGEQRDGCARHRGSRLREIPALLRVKPGDKVASGQQLARVGTSGDANVPHLHFELSTSPQQFIGEGGQVERDPEWIVVQPDSRPEGARNILLALRKKPI